MTVFPNTIRTLLRRLRVVAPDARTVSWHGEARDVFLSVTEKQGFREQPQSTRAEIHFYPGEDFDVSRIGSAEAVLVVARSLAGSTLPPHLHSHRSARRSLPLREWVRGWAGPAARLLVSPAVADRPISVRWPGCGEWIFVRHAAALPPRAPTETLKFLLVTYFGAGMFPIMPATVGCIFMLPPAFAIYAICGMKTFLTVSAFVAVLATVGSVMLERWAERRFLSDDPREFVLDEVAGLALTWACLPASAPWCHTRRSQLLRGILLGCLAFRVFDIFKFGVGWVEKLPVRGKVVWDDLLAGFYAGVLTWLIVR